MKTGLNLIAIPSDTTCKSELNDWLPMIGDDAEIEAVMAYDRQTGLISTLIPEDESNPNFVLEGGDGLMVYAKQPTDITFPSLLCEALEFKEGLNIMGFSCPPAGYTAFQFLSDLGSDSAASIQRHDTDTGRFETAGFDESGLLIGVDFPIVPGEGYFIHMKEIYQSSPSGQLTEYGECKDFRVYSYSASALPDQDCVEYEFLESGMLKLKHINAGFNCCPEQILADIDIESNAIAIAEKEINGYCDCHCLYDLNYEIDNLEPGQYQVKFDEPYAQTDDEGLEFTIDLVAEPSGYFCVKRNHYPWH